MNNPSRHIIMCQSLIFRKSLAIIVQQSIIILHLLGKNKNMDAPSPQAIQIDIQKKKYQSERYIQIAVSTTAIMKKFFLVFF